MTTAPVRRRIALVSTPFPIKTKASKALPKASSKSSSHEPTEEVFVNKCIARCRENVAGKMAAERARPVDFMADAFARNAKAQTERMDALITSLETRFKDLPVDEDDDAVKPKHKRSHRIRKTHVSHLSPTEERKAQIARRRDKKITFARPRPIAKAIAHAPKTVTKAPRSISKAPRSAVREAPRKLTEKVMHQGYKYTVRLRKDSTRFIMVKGRRVSV